MTDDSKEPWHQTNLGSGVISGLIVLIVGSSWTGLVATVAQLPWWVSVAAALIAGLAVTGLIVPRFRRWLFSRPSGIWSRRPMSRRQFEAMRDSFVVSLRREAGRREAETAQHADEATRLLGDTKGVEDELVVSEQESERLRHEIVKLEQEVANAQARRVGDQQRATEQGRIAVAEAVDRRDRRHAAELERLTAEQAEASTAMVEQYQQQIADGFAKAQEWEKKARAAEEQLRTQHLEIGASAKRMFEEGRQAGAEAAGIRESERQANANALRAQIAALEKRLTGSTPSKARAEQTRRLIAEMQPYVPEPHWRIAEDPEQHGLWTIGSTIAESKARRLRLKFERDDFDLLEGGYWESVSGNEQKQFRGEPSFWARQNNLLFTVTWVAPDGKAHQVEGVRAVQQHRHPDSDPFEP